MKTNLYTKMPTYKPSEKVWQNIEKELDNLRKQDQHKKYQYLWGLAASFVLICFIVLSLAYKTKTSFKNKNTEQANITYTEETLDTTWVKNTTITTIKTDIEVENLCEAQPIKCEDEYAKSLLKQIQDLSNASAELDQASVEQSIPDLDLQKQKAQIEKEKHKRIKKLKRYLNE